MEDAGGRRMELWQQVPEPHLEFPGDPARPAAGLDGVWQDQGRDSCQQPLSSSSERAAVVPRLWPSTPPTGFRNGF